jgi:hypothetical protein
MRSGARTARLRRRSIWQIKEGLATTTALESTKGFEFRRFA